MSTEYKDVYYLFLKFNNYSNRKIIGYATVDEYLNIVGDNYSFDTDRPHQFNPNDYITTEIIENDVDPDYDYLIIVNSDNEIVSRWFIMANVRTRAGQHKVSLRRDVIYDHLEELKQSPIFVQKGMLSDNDPLIFNSEGMNFNQIKKSETLLKDRSKTAWIVGYMSKSAAPTDVAIQVADEDFEYIPLNDIATAMGISEARLASIINVNSTTNPAYFTTKVELRYSMSFNNSHNYGDRVRQFFSPDFSSFEYLNFNEMGLTGPLFHGTTGTSLLNLYNTIGNQVVARKTTILSEMDTITNRTYFTENQLNTLKKFSKKVIYYNGAYYTLSIQTASTSEQVVGPYIYTYFNGFSAAISAAAASITDATLNSQGIISIRPTSTQVYVVLNTLSVQSGVFDGITTKISSARRTTYKQAFDAFAIPYGATDFIDMNGNNTSIEDYALAVASAIATKLDSALYDVQLLPYCPLLEKYNSEDKIDLTALTEGKDFDYIKRTNTTKTFNRAFSCTFNYLTATATLSVDIDVPYNLIQTITHSFSSGTSGVSGPVNESFSYSAVSGDSTKTHIEYSVSFEEVDPSGVFVGLVINATYLTDSPVSFILYLQDVSFQTTLEYSLSLSNTMKIESECNKYRLCSPNYQGSFDFNVAKNGGKVDNFIAFCTYKPYTPYIKVVPAFGGLYGSNFGDCRGLICGGDFSLPRFTSAWETFLLNNKNYQNIFNRDIQNLDFTQSLEMRNQLVSGAVGIFGDTTKTAAAGSMVGGPIGAAAGATVGAAASALGFAIDVDTLARQHREARSLAVDKYNYQLGNIKALPYTLTKVGAFDINSKIYPFLEYYTCTDEEKEALESKITYESMTVMKIFNLGQFIDMEGNETLHYFKGELIRNNELFASSQMMEAIYNELLKGVYI